MLFVPRETRIAGSPDRPLSHRPDPVRSFDSSLLRSASMDIGRSTSMMAQHRATLVAKHERTTRLTDRPPLIELHSVRTQKFQPFDTCTQSHDVSFPFEKLPTELRLMILRFIILPHGLRAFASPLSNDDPAYEPARRARLKHLREEDVVPTGVFRTTKWISAMALHIFDKEFCVHFNILATTINCRWEEYRGPFSSQISARQSQLLSRTNNYQLNLGGWLALFEYEMDPRVQAGTTVSSRLLKESLRQICDALAKNRDLRRLVVTMPCLCTVTNGQSWTSQVLSGTLDYLSPLQRLRLVESVRLLPTPGFQSNSDIQICRQPACSHFVDCVRAQMGCPRGEELTDRERKWKKIKAIGNLAPESTPARHLLVECWEHLDEGSPEEFNAYTEDVMRLLESAHRRQQLSQLYLNMYC